MDARQLSYFRVMARYEHMGKAAAELGLTDSALSRSIARLESQCGTELFDRVGRGLRLNGYGRALLTRVDRALAELDNIEREMQAMVNAGQPCITLGFVPSLGVRQVPDLVMQFTRSHPETVFNLQQGGTNELHEHLVAGTIDLFLGTQRPPDPAIDWQPLWTERLVALVAPGHRFAARPIVDLVDIAHEPLITFKSGQTVRQTIDDLGRTGGFTPNVVFESDQLSTLLGLAGAGFGVAVVPESLAPAGRKTVKVRIQSRPRRTVGVATLRGRFQSPLARVLLADLARRAKVRGR